MVRRRFSLADGLSLIGTIGSVLSLHVFGQVIVVLNTAKAAKDLLERRAGIYSDRPPIPFLDMCALDL
jgi:hypothetical protein